jgi:large subunit ribosomal protein L24
MNIKKDDHVIILTGRDKGKSGKVIKSLPKVHKVIVAGVNIMKKNQKPRKQGQKGQIVEVTMPIDVSNVRLEGEKKAPKKVTAKKK